MDFDACLMAAKAAGKVDPARADMAQKEYLDLVERYKLSERMTEADARIAAGDEVVASFTRRAKARQHYELKRLQWMKEKGPRYADAEKGPAQIQEDLLMAEREEAGLKRQFLGGITDFMNAHARNLIGEVRQRSSLRDVVRELFGENSGNATAKAMAEAILKQYERARSLANSYGMDIPKLDDWGLPHTHNWAKIKKAGFEAWFRALYTNLDWSRIENFDTGKPFAVAKGAKPLEADARKFLQELYGNRTRHGWLKREPGMSFGAAGLKNARTGHRVLHFKDADGWMAYNELFGAANPFEAIINHFGGMARDIALMRRFGPNPAGGLEFAVQTAEKAIEMAGGPKAEKRLQKLHWRAKLARGTMSVLSGRANDPGSEVLAAIGSDVRNYNVASMLGSSPLTMMTDIPAMAFSSMAAGMSPFSPIKELVKETFHLTTLGMDAQTGRELGFILERTHSYNQGRISADRDIWSSNWSNWLSETAMRFNAMTYIDNRERMSMFAAFGADLAKLADRSFDKLPRNTKNLLRNREFTPADWDAVRDSGAIFTDPVGGKHINPKWFLENTSLPRAEAEEIAIKLGGVIEDFVEMALPTRNAAATAAMTAGTAPGTFWGEFIRSGKQFKSYPVMMMINVQRRARDVGGARGLAWAASLAAASTLFGAFSLQLREIIKGRDPRPMDTPEFWIAAFLQGGSIGILGDFLTSATSRTGGDLAEVLAGPTVGLIADAMRANGPNVVKAFQGKETHFAKDNAKFVLRNNPLASNWAIRTAFGRLVEDNMLRFIDPSAEADFHRYMRQQQRDYGTGFWWQHGQNKPSRLPDLGNALGGNQ